MSEHDTCSTCKTINESVEWVPDPYYDLVFRQIKGIYLCPDCYWDRKCEAEDECQD